MITVPKKLAMGLPALAFLLTLLFVPFRHRTLVTGADGRFTFVEERVWAPLWDQPTFAGGVAEYPFRVLLVEWGLLAVVAAGLTVLRRRSRGPGGSS